MDILRFSELMAETCHYGNACRLSEACPFGINRCADVTADEWVEQFLTPTYPPVEEVETCHSCAMYSGEGTCRGRNAAVDPRAHVCKLWRHR